MKYIYLDPQGNPVGPVDESAVVQAIRDGVLKADSPIRNALLREFYTVADFNCFAEALGQTTAAEETRKPASKDGGFAFGYLARLAADQVKEIESNTIAGKLVPGDAAASRRFLAMLMDAVLLTGIILLIYLPALAGMKNLGTRDEAEFARIQVEGKKLTKALKQQERRMAQEAKEAEKTQRREAQKNAMREQSDSSTGFGSEKPHSTQRALVNRVAPNALRKLDNAYAQHNTAVESAAQDSGGKAQEKKKKPKPARAPRKTFSGDTATPSASPPAEATAEAAPAEPPAQAEDPLDDITLKGPEIKQVLLQKMPGGGRFAQVLPQAARKLERKYTKSVQIPPPEKRAEPALGDFLITGFSSDAEAIYLRVGGDIRKVPRAEFRARFLRPVKWAVLAVLLYYTLTFSIFAQTVGMWFWGIFLTRSRVAEVLPFRAVLYTVCMLLFGVLMIPMVLISKRSLADWLCGVRQIGVGSVSKS